MVADKLAPYRGKRSRARTPEPVPEAADLPAGNNDTFVIQEHHARALHWDFRLERDGVLVSWALPKGLPNDPKTNHLAILTEDHPLEYASFSGEIPAGEYGGGTVTIWDHGRYETEKWREDEVIVVLHGQRAQGRFALFKTGGKNWMIHRMDAPARPGWQPMPALIKPMMASPADKPPADEAAWAYEMKWDGLRAVVYVQGGRARVLTRNDRDVSSSFPELSQMAEALGTKELILDGEIVALDKAGRPDFGLLQQRMHVTSATAVRDLAARIGLSYLAFDLLYEDGELLLDKTYDERRKALEALELNGEFWAVPPAFTGGGRQAIESSKELGLEGVIAKRRKSHYQPGKRSRDWLKIKNIRTQEVVIGGWAGGQGKRTGGVGSLLLGVPGPDGLHYVGKVGTGFTVSMLSDLARMLKPRRRQTSPFVEPPPSAIARDAVWVEPELVGEVAFTEWTSEGRIRHPSWRGLRPDKSPAEVIRET